MRLSPLITYFSLLLVGSHAEPSSSDKALKAACYVQPHKQSIFTPAHAPHKDQYNSLGLCVSYCRSKSNLNRYAGAQNNLCYCGKSLGAGAQSAKAKQCNSPCPGYPKEHCGGLKRVSVVTL